MHITFLPQEDEDSTLKKEGDKDGENASAIDIVGVQPIPAFCSRYKVHLHTKQVDDFFMVCYSPLKCACTLYSILSLKTW